MSTISLCIPMVDKKINKKFIFSVFKRLDIGHISYIKLTNVKGTDTNMAFIYFNRLKVNERVERMKQLLLCGDCIKVMYSFPLFWKCYKNRNTVSTKSVEHTASTEKGVSSSGEMTTVDTNPEDNSKSCDIESSLRNEKIKIDVKDKMGVKEKGVLDEEK